MNIRSRRAGCLFGGAIGDAFGYAIEFSSWSTIKRKYGPRGLVDPVMHDGRLIVSDDTQMTLFTLEGLLDCEAEEGVTVIVERIRGAYLDWLSTQTGNPDRGPHTGRLWQQAVLQVPRAPGNCCLTSLQAGGKGSPEQPINDNKGCGGVMRVAPLGIYPHNGNPRRAFELAMRAAAITHTHPSGYLSAGMLAAALSYVMDGESLLAAVERSLETLSAYAGHSETLRAVQQALALASSDEIDALSAIESLGEGWVGEEALAIGIYATLKADSYPDVIRIAANHGGDSDSTASIAGQLYGAHAGVEMIPAAWIEALDVGPILTGLLADMD